MKNLLAQFIQIYQTDAEFQREINNFQLAIKSHQWKFYKQMLLIIKGIMANDMFSKQFTTLDTKEKDIAQRTYYNIDQILTFLLDPLKWIEKKSKWQGAVKHLKKEQK